MEENFRLPAWEALLPDRLAQQDFFVCDVFDAALKSDMPGMEHPLFTLAKHKDVTARRYESGNNYIEISPSVAHGRATVYDRDILIYCISQIIAALNEGRKVTSRTVRFKALDMLKATNRPTDGRSYLRLRDTFERLRGTTISTNILTGGKETAEVFGIVDDARVVRETKDGRMLDCEVTLSRWVFNAIEAHEVLTLSPDYFRLRKPLERRIYEIARKHCGNQRTWRIGLDKLQAKCGSHSDKYAFRQMVSKIVAENDRSDHMPDYTLAIEGSQVVFMSRGTAGVLNDGTPALSIPPLDPDTYEDACEIAQGWDVRFIEQEWRTWAKEVPKNPDAAFMGFVAKWVAKRGAA